MIGQLQVSCARCVRKLLTKSAHQDANGTSPTIPPPMLPAELTKTWALLNLALTLAKSDLTLDSSETSVGSAIMGIDLEILVMLSTVRSRVSALRPTRTIPAAPAWAHAFAIAWYNSVSFDGLSCLWGVGNWLLLYLHRHQWWWWPFLWRTKLD